jgi:hypothetical protein
MIKVMRNPIPRLVVSNTSDIKSCRIKKKGPMKRVVGNDTMEWDDGDA